MKSFFGLKDLKIFIKYLLCLSFIRNQNCLFPETNYKTSKENFFFPTQERRLARQTMFLLSCASLCFQTCR